MNVTEDVLVAAPQTDFVGVAVEYRKPTGRTPYGSRSERIHSVRWCIDLDSFFKSALSVHRRTYFVLVGE